MKTLLKILLVLLLPAVAFAGYLCYSIEKPFRGYAAESTYVTVPHGASRRAVARILEQQGIIRSALAFEIYSRRHPKRTLQAGEYAFDSPVSGREVFWKLANGQVYEQPFTVREGETIFDIARDLEAAKFIPADDFLQAAKNPELIQDIAPQAKSLEGFLYPATYHLPRHPAANELAAEMVKKFREQWTRIKQQTPGTESGVPVVSAVTLASLVERETPRPEERPLVAGVFENRLRRDMPLQCDPTVIYALEQAGQYQGTLTGRDLHVDSPYNTYVHTGLPPGPIGNPSEQSLRAALRPATTNYLYFVANTQGGHFFGATLAEHNKNVTRYRRLLAGLSADPPPEPVAASHKKSQPKKNSSHKGKAK